MPRYRVTLQRPSTEIIDADNPYMAAVVAAQRHGDGVQVVDVRQAAGRAAGTTKKVPAKKAPAKKRRPLSPEARAQLAKNLERARAAKARNMRAAKKTARKRQATKKR